MTNARRRFCRMGTSFLIFFTHVSIQNDQTPRILHNHFWVTLTHTPALPIHNERNYLELKRRERDTHTQPTPERKRARERGRKHMLYQSVATHSRPNSLVVKIQSDTTRIYFERSSPHSRVGEDGRRDERVNGRERERASERTGERETEKQKERETHISAQEREREEREREREIEIERPCCCTFNTRQCPVTRN